MKEQNVDLTKLEFLMTVNDNFIVQRYFNVKDYNPKAKNSVELMDVLDGFVEQLKHHLKLKTVTYMTDNQYEISENPEVLETSFTDGPEVFNLYLKYNGNIMCHYTFDAKPYPPKVRYTVDIRPYLKGILSTLTEVFSTKNLTHKMMGYSLV
jgi:hypothetical protein